MQLGSGVARLKVSLPTLVDAQTSVPFAGGAVSVHVVSMTCFQSTHRNWPDQAAVDIDELSLPYE